VGGDKTGQGYNRSPGLAQKFVDFLGDLPVFVPPTEALLEPIKEKTYGELFGTNSEGKSSANMPRRKELYQSPLVIIAKSPGDDPNVPRAYISDHPVAFSQSYYGYSCAGHPDAETLAALIHLLAHSTVFDYFCLMTSSQSGFDRQCLTSENSMRFRFQTSQISPQQSRQPFVAFRGDCNKTPLNRERT
jgi:hypothetical protein